MDLNSLTQAELHNALGMLFLTIGINAAQVSEILKQTEKFDPELSMRVVEGLKSAMEAGNELLMDSYRKQGLTDAQIQSRIEYGRRLFGLDP